MSLDVAGPYRYPAPNARWLARRVEAILEPDRPIVDAHHHIWEQDGNPYLLDDLADDIASGHNIRATVFVQAHYGYRTDGPTELRCVGETEQVLSVVAEAARRGMTTRVCAGIVAFADLALGARVEAVLEAHLAAAGGRLRGVRHSVSRDPEFPDGIVLRPAPAMLLADATFRRALAKVADFGLAFDAMLYHRQIPELTALAKAMPQLSIVLDHFGCIIGVGPYRGREQETFKSWRDDIRDLARCPNVTVKLGGKGMIICGPTYHERPSPPGSEELAEAWRPFVETCVEAFGAGRCMFESNFPVDKAMFSYPVLWNAFKRLASEMSEDEKDMLFQGTATRVYRLEVPA